ncbi:hypothetical protein SLEP1_g41265 [Rubroshorea leprosula]|uniref:Uncharacterized protein n=1 Tax=Rubroshorea leprosula TaxID=152421 RepID=A0AAV5L6F2_9ROSI|nr:hypothetical protein SLEP1_g41265 [Rubroshorea leprosula]
MANLRRNSYSNENPFQTQTTSSLSSFTHFLKKPQAFPFLLLRLLLLTLLFLKLQPSSPSHGFLRNHEKWSQDDDRKANLARFKVGFPYSITKDKCGWLLNPITLVLNSGVKDVSESEGGGKASGAFSNAVPMVLKENLGPLSNKEVVMMAKKVLQA